MDYGPEICIIETLLFLLAQQDQESIGLVRDFAVTLTVAGAALVLFRRIKLPPVLGYLLAGVIVGPFTFAGINFGPFTDLRGPVQNLGTIRLLADLGLVFLLFGIGLEIGWQRIRQIGLRVIIIGFVEMTTMFVLGYEIAYLLGWTPLEQVFLGAALSISSSAILIKMLRDTGTLFDPQGRIIVGVLLVEDFVAVIMLTVLSGIATTGGANIGDIGALAAKLAIFGTAALAFGALLAPRLIRYIARFESEEVTLITSLALCFSLALAGYELGLSAAAGAFVIGMVLGDTEHSEDISRVMSPLRDMFAALFFVSIGMLIDIFTVVEFLVPALIISAVFILGKVVSDTTGAILSGHDGRTSLRVGMSMPQIGEFSLAMIKTGVENGAVSAFISPVITVATAITALFYPLIFHSHARVANFIDRISPLWLKEYANVLFLWLTASRRAFILNTPLGHRIKHSVQFILLNMGIIVVIITLGTVVLQFSDYLSGWINVGEGLVGLITGGSVLALCIPSGVAVWRNLRQLTESVMNQVLPRWTASHNPRGQQSLRVVLRNSILILILILPTIWSVPFVARLLSLGNVATPIPALILIGVTVGVALAAFQIHGTLEDTFRRTFLGADHYGQNLPEPDYRYEDSHLPSDTGGLEELPDEERLEVTDDA